MLHNLTINVDLDRDEPQKLRDRKGIGIPPHHNLINRDAAQGQKLFGDNPAKAQQGLLRQEGQQQSGNQHVRRTTAHDELLKDVRVDNQPA